MPPQTQPQSCREKRRRGAIRPRSASSRSGPDSRSHHHLMLPAPRGRGGRPISGGRPTTRPFFTQAPSLSSPLNSLRGVPYSSSPSQAPLQGAPSVLCPSPLAVAKGPNSKASSRPETTNHPVQHGHAIRGTVNMFRELHCHALRLWSQSRVKENAAHLTEVIDHSVFQVLQGCRSTSVAQPSVLYGRARRFRIHSHDKTSSRAGHDPSQEQHGCAVSIQESGVTQLHACGHPVVLIFVACVGSIITKLSMCRFTLVLFVRSLIAQGSNFEGVKLRKLLVISVGNHSPHVWSSCWTQQRLLWKPGCSFWNLCFMWRLHPHVLIFLNWRLKGRLFCSLKKRH